ncbi:hypothetical protein MTR_3g062317 [Medicago truncatula]|uniref:Uncharacterized protein n=1 Tax=Medicago truncatula TaxID=3880 RepID=A0A072UY67_MEDTR|nr:hypothetical protein MTR_3g062317 [Medicago truncatula]
MKLGPVFLGPKTGYNTSNYVSRKRPESCNSMQLIRSVQAFTAVNQNQTHHS